METRISYHEIDPKLLRGLGQIESYVSTAGIDPKLVELVKFRVSQINHCAFCLDMHFKEAIHLGETELRLYSLSAWRETPYYSDAEQAALAYAEALTRPAETGLPDQVYEALTRYFETGQVVALTAAIANINTWNRLNHAFRPEPGKYEVGMFAVGA